MEEFVTVIDGQGNNKHIPVKEEIGAIEDSNYQLIEEYNAKERDERHQVADDVRSQIAELVSNKVFLSCTG